MGGLMGLTGMPGHPPTRAGGSIADVAAAYLAFGAIGAALVHRLRTGSGQHLDVNLLAATLGLLPDPVAHLFDSGKRPARVGNRNPTLTPAEAFRTQDGWLNVVLMNPAQWERFCRVLGDEVLRTEPRFATNLSRLENHDEMKSRVETALAAGTTAEWVTRFEAASIAGGPIYELDEVFQDPQVQHLGLLAEVEQPTYEAHEGRARMLGFPFRASATPASIRRPAPLLGEHTSEVLSEVLGLAPAEITRLAETGAIAVAPRS
jgi:crotonobetainyl-CoA:carnitine CoA-transferase CaiB-like acyl-CoA transferase